METKTSKQIMHDCQDCTVDLKEKFVKVKDILAFLASVSYQKVNGKIERVNIDHRKIEKALIDLNKNCHLPTIITYLHKESKGE